MIVPYVPFGILVAAALVSAKPIQKRQSALLAEASLLNNAVAYSVCLVSRGAFAAVIAIGAEVVNYPACAAYDLLNPVVSSASSTLASTTTTVPVSSVASSTTSSSAFVTPTNSVGSLAFPYCPATAPTSCSAYALTNNATIDTCCTNSPSGYFLQTQFWDNYPAQGPNTSWTIHGLWSDNCDGTYPAFCDNTRAYTNISAIMANGGALGVNTLNYMNTYWKDGNGNDSSFWTHEFSKHGTCMSSLNTTCYGSTYIPQQEVVQYFARTVALFKNLPSYDWLAAAGIVPSITANYTIAQLQAVAVANTGYNAYYGCSKAGALSEIWYGYVVSGNVANGVFTNAQILSNSSCPATGIKYYPKGYSPPVVVVNSTSTTLTSSSTITSMSSTSTTITSSTSSSTTTH